MYIPSYKTISYTSWFNAHILTSSLNTVRSFLETVSGTKDIRYSFPSIRKDLYFDGIIGERNLEWATVSSRDLTLRPLLTKFQSRRPLESPIALGIRWDSWNWTVLPSVVAICQAGSLGCSISGQHLQMDRRTKHRLHRATEFSLSLSKYFDRCLCW